VNMRLLYSNDYTVSRQVGSLRLVNRTDPSRVKTGTVFGLISPGVGMAGDGLVGKSWGQGIAGRLLIP